MLSITFSTEGAAFRDPADGDEDPTAKAEEVARLLVEVAEKVRDGHRSGNVLDFNGNTVGNWSLD